jgi:hypothetical protein
VTFPQRILDLSLLRSGQRKPMARTRLCVILLDRNAF